MKKYHYIGPEHILERVERKFAGKHIRAPKDVKKWADDTGQTLENGRLIVTFVIDPSGRLLITDRRSEHVQCAVGRPVFSAGEMTFEFHKKSVVVTEVSNQSTGYCPHVRSWPSVEKALEKVGFEHPGLFTTCITFGKCPNCLTNAIVKPAYPECGKCGTDYVLLG